MKNFLVLIGLLTLGLKNVESDLIEFICDFTIIDLANCKPMKQVSIQNRSNNIQIYNYDATNHSSVKNLRLESFTMYYLPINFDSFFKSIKNLTIIETQLKEISKEDLGKFQDLEELSITHNNLTYIDDNLFKNNEKIKKVDFSYNIIYSIPDTFKKQLGENLIVVENCLDVPVKCDETLNKKNENFIESTTSEISVKNFDDIISDDHEKLTDNSKNSIETSTENEHFKYISVINDVKMKRNENSKCFPIIHQCCENCEENQKTSKWFSMIHLTIESLQFLLILFLLYKIKSKTTTVISQQQIQPQNRESFDPNYDEFPGIIHNDNTSKVDDEFYSMYDEIKKKSNEALNTRFEENSDALPVYAVVDKKKKNAE